VSFDSIPLVREVKPREGWMRTEGFLTFSIPIQPHFHDEFPALSLAEFNLLIGYQLWWINAPVFARHEMINRQCVFGPSAWTAFVEVKETPELIASQIRAALHSSKPKRPAIQIFANPICFEPTAKVLEVASTISDILADMDATIPQQIEDQKTLLRFIEEDRANNPVADATYRENEYRTIKARIKKLINKMNGHGGSNWITPLNQQITNPESFK
jgi:hypothetical protein